MIVKKAARIKKINFGLISSKTKKGQSLKPFIGQALFYLKISIRASTRNEATLRRVSANP